MKTSIEEKIRRNTVMPFFELQDIQDIPLVNGITLKAVYGEKCSVSFLELSPFSSIPAHHHENEQIGIVIEGELEYTIGDETRRCRNGTAFVVPPNTIHSAVVVSEQPAKLIDVFTPPRKITESLKYTEK
jgi:quercetin dioxygenase-like cupin family protein